MMGPKPKQKSSISTKKRDALAVRDADKHSAAEVDVDLEELISHLGKTLSNLQEARGKKKKTP